MKLITRQRALTHEPLVSDNLPYVRHINERVIGMRGGRMLCTLELEGASFATADIEDLNALHTKLNLLWRSNNDERLALWTHTIRTLDRNYPDAEFRSDFAYWLDAKYRARITGERLFKNRLFLSLVWVPARDKDGLRSFGAKLGRAHRTGQELDPHALHDFEGVIQNIVAGLSRYEVRTLRLYEHNGLVYSEPMEFLNAIGILDFGRMPLVEGQIANALMAERPLFGREVIELRGAGASRYAGILGIKEYPAATTPGMLNDLLRAPFESVLTQSFGMLSKADGRAILSRKQNQMVSVGERALSQIDDLDAAMDDLESNRFVMGKHHMSLMVVAATPDGLMDNMAHARRMLSDCGVVSAREDLALESQYWGQWPGNFHHRPRSGHITSKNFAAFAPFHSYPKGRPSCEWGPPVALLKTASGCAFHFNFHYGDLGNTFICGPSGSGKTVVQNFMLAQLQKHDATMVFFDKDRGAEIFVRAAGGTYLRLRNGEPTGCAPLKAFDLEVDRERSFAVEWVTKLVERPGEPMSVDDAYFVVRFGYPADEAERRRREAAARHRAAEKKWVDRTLSLHQAYAARNYRYSAQGSRALQPEMIFDDGKVTTMTFAGNREIPAIYMVQSDGEETLIPWDARDGGEVVVIHGTAREFRLRRGGDVLCIFNEAYDPVGVNPGTGTTSPSVERVIKPLPRGSER